MEILFSKNKKEFTNSEKQKIESQIKSKIAGKGYSSTFDVSHVKPDDQQSQSVLINCKPGLVVTDSSTNHSLLIKLKYSKSKYGRDNWKVSFPLHVPLLSAAATDTSSVTDGSASPNNGIQKINSFWGKIITYNNLT